MSTNTKGRRSKVHRVILAVCIASFVAAYGASLLWHLGYQKSDYWVMIESGALGVIKLGETSHDTIYVVGYVNSGWTFARNNRAPSVIQWPRFHFDDSGQTPMTMHVVIPLWIPLLALLALAALLIYRDRTRRVPGFCRKCGYDLRTITAPRCPECGVIVENNHESIATNT